MQVMHALGLTSSQGTASALGAGAAQTPQLAGMQMGANVPRNMMPQGQQDQEMLNRGWHAYMTANRTGNPSADQNMSTTPPMANDQLEVSTGKYSGLGQRTMYPNDPTNVSDKKEMPQLGPMQGKAFLNPLVAPSVPSGAARPLGPGEYVQNPDGSWSNEITTTVEKGAAPTLNGGKPSVVPTLWVINGVPTRVDEDTAAELAAKSGLQFPSFDSNDQAEKFADQRESNWQTVAPQQSAKVPALWTVMPTSVGR